MLGRSMAGSQAVIAHDEAGPALFVAYDPPAMPLSQVIVAYCQQVAEATGRALLVIDRAVHALAVACAFEAQALGLLCMRDDHEPRGLESFEATQVDTRADGTRVSRGPWKAPSLADPRPFVLVEPAEGKTLVSWATPQVAVVLEPTAWPRVSRARSEMQENSGKRMMDHGARNRHDGRKKRVGADRHQQRAREQLDQALASAQKRVDKQGEALKVQQAQLVESASKGQSTRLAQRQHAWGRLEKALKATQDQQDGLAAQATALGPPRERADRDCRKQTIMTLRTLLLENALRAFRSALLGSLQTTGSVERVLPLLFERRGARMETSSQVVYWVNTAGLSVPYRRVLTEGAGGLGTMDLREKGQPIQVRLKDMPP